MDTAENGIEVDTFDDFCRLHKLFKSPDFDQIELTVVAIAAQELTMLLFFIKILVIFDLREIPVLAKIEAASRVISLDLLSDEVVDLAV